MKKGLLLAAIIGSTVAICAASIGSSGGMPIDGKVPNKTTIPTVGSSQHGLLISQFSSTLWQHEKAAGVDAATMTQSGVVVSIPVGLNESSKFGIGADCQNKLERTIANSTSSGADAVKGKMQQTMIVAGANMRSVQGDGIMVETLFGGKSQKAAINSLFYRHLLTA